VALRIRRSIDCVYLGSVAVVISGNPPFLVRGEEGSVILADMDLTSFVFFTLIAAKHEKRVLDTDYDSQDRFV
jgi:hypothetical protein